MFNYSSGGLNVSLDDLIKLKRLKESQKKDDLPDDIGETSDGMLFRIDSDPMSGGGMDIDEAMRYRSPKVRR